MASLLSARRLRWEDPSEGQIRSPSTSTLASRGALLALLCRPRRPRACGRGHLGRSPGLWISASPRLPTLRQWHLAGQLPTHSGGPAPDSHRLPYSPLPGHLDPIPVSRGDYSGHRGTKQAAAARFIAHRDRSLSSRAAPNSGQQGDDGHHCRVPRPPRLTAPRSWCPAPASVPEVGIPIAMEHFSSLSK